MLEVSPRARGRGFAVLTASWVVSLTGDGVRMVALPLTAALLTSNPLAVTAVAAAELLPWLLLSLPAGALVDRWDPRTVVVAGHLVRVVLSLALAAALLTGSAGIAALCVAAFTLTVADTFADAAQQVVLVRLVPRRRLTWANARFRTVETLTLVTVGPVLGGVLVAVSPGLAFAVDGATFLVAGLLGLALPRSRRAPARPGRAVLADLTADVREGLAVVVRTPVLRVLAGTTLAASVAVGGVNAMLALFALDTLGLPVATVPLLLVGQAAGVLVGARTVTGLVARRGDGPVLVAALVLTGLAFAVVGLAPVVAVVFPAYVVSGVGFGWWNVAVAARRQRVTPDALQARVANANRTVGWGAMPLGAGAGGGVAALLGQPAVFVAGGALLVVAALVARPGLLRPARPGEVEAAARAR
ncbi:MFS transporter [Rhodococcus aerolatus]